MKKHNWKADWENITLEMDMFDLIKRRVANSFEKNLFVALHSKNKRKIKQAKLAMQKRLMQICNVKKEAP